MRHIWTLAALALLALCVPGAAAPAPEPPSPQTTFFQANALYNEGRYADAVQLYERLLASGTESAPLFFNLGNAYFKVGDQGRAILNYERALRLAQRDPDVQANLAYAQSLSGVTVCAAPLWQRLLVPLANRMSTNGLALLTSAVYSLLFLLLAAYQLWRPRPRWMVYAAGALGALLLVAAGSLVFQAWAQARPSAVVIRAGETPVRFEPAANGTVHYALKVGTLVDVLEQRDGWWQVARCDGRRGWIPQDAIERVQYPD